jgi:endonuclease/exonuclease/phosphatase family metal-dependent hydrolase
MPRRITVFVIALIFTAISIRAQQPPVTVRAMTYNIHHGEGLDRQVNLERIARIITDANADIVALQEVDRGCERTQKRDLPAELATLTGMKVHFEKNIAYQGGEYGNAVLTKFPVKTAKNMYYRMLRPGEQRGVLQLVLDVHGRDVLVMNTHLDYQPDETERMMNADELRQIASDAANMPIILMGDFNAIPGSRPIEKIKAFLTDAWERVGEGDGFTIPVLEPAKRIDYIWTSGETVEPVWIRVLPSEASDHLPVLAELRIKSPRTGSRAGRGAPQPDEG